LEISHLEGQERAIRMGWTCSADGGFRKQNIGEETSWKAATWKTKKEMLEWVGHVAQTEQRTQNFGKETSWKGHLEDCERDGNIA
jgi:hypothetical protein